MARLFISHATDDDAFIRTLREQLEQRGSTGWADSRELRGGDPLWPEIAAAIEKAEAFMVVVSPASLQSDEVAREISHARKVQEERGRDRFRIVPVSLNGTKLGVINRLLGTTPLHIEVKSDPGGIDAAMSDLLASLGLRLPTDKSAAEQPKTEPLEELVLELTELGFHEEAGVRRASARARLVYEPAAEGQDEVKSAKSWRLVAPIGPIEAEELRWYLEKFAVWPSDFFRDRAQRVEESLTEWGRLLYEAAMPLKHVATVLQAWAGVRKGAGRRFSVHIDKALDADASKEDEKLVKEAATVLLGLPWELLHDGKAFLFQGAEPTRVRRRLPKTEQMPVAVVDPPIRILLVTARPEDDACGYIDHRASALPLVETTETLGGLVKIHVLSPATLGALSEELDRARAAKKPYHVVHFDGHGVYDKAVGLGGLCFENPQDARKLSDRRHVTVYTTDLGPLLTEHRVPLVFLDACQTALAEKASESVASELLKVGVASVVAMSHSVLVETARQFVESFYRALAEGKRVGDAMLAGQRGLKSDTFRARIFGVGELRLEDWFVPVLYQEKEDPQLFRATPSKRTKEDVLAGLKARMGALPPEPGTGFVGRSRDLLALERLLHRERYAVVRGQGGEGKTALAAELGRWMVRSHQVQRAAFVSVELHTNAAAVVNELGAQLVAGYQVVAADKMEEGVLQVERALEEQATLLVMDNMESILMPPFMVEQTPKALTEDAEHDLTEILALAERLNKKGETRVVFTSRELLPAPFDAPGNRWELVELGLQDAVKLVERVLNESHTGIDHAANGDAAAKRAADDAATGAIEDLVDAVNRNARALTNLAPSIRAMGVERTRESLVELMAEMERKFPGNREQSVFASVELSLRRLSPPNRAMAAVLGVFHGGVHIMLLQAMMSWKEEDLVSLADALVETGLATASHYGHLVLNPALCPYLRDQMDPAERERLTALWAGTMRAYTEFLDQQRAKNVQISVALALLELPGLLALLEHTERSGDTAETIAQATRIHSLLRNLGRPRLLQRIAQVRDQAAQKLGDTWTHVAFLAHLTRTEDHFAAGRLREAREAAERLHRRSLSAGDTAYPDADYDVAVAHFLLGRVLKASFRTETALGLLNESQARFEAVEQAKPGRGAARMAAVCITERGDCLRDLGLLDEAAAAYQEAIRRARTRGDVRSLAVASGQLGTVRLAQHRYADALEAHGEARKQFTLLNEPGHIAVSWYMTGLVHQGAGQSEAAEDSYRKSLAIDVQLGNLQAQAGTLNALGNLYDRDDRLEEAVAFYRRAIDAYVGVGDVAMEGITRNNLGGTLRNLGRLDEARREISRAIECAAQLGHAAEVWKTWSILADIERDAGRIAAAAGDAQRVQAAELAAALADRRALEAFLVYRRAGGENHYAPGRLAFMLTQALKAGDTSGASVFLLRFAAQFLQPGAAAHPATVHIRAYIRALEAIVAGARDPSIANDPNLNYIEAAEITVLLEALKRSA